MKEIFNVFDKPAQEEEQIIIDLNQYIFDLEQKLGVMDVQIKKLEEEGIGFGAIAKLKQLRDQKEQLMKGLVELRQKLDEAIENRVVISKHKAAIDSFQPVIESDPKKRN